jgi:hypothetical protein
MLVVAGSLTGCAGGEALLSLGSSVGMAAAAPRQTYRLAQANMIPPSEHLSASLFPEGLHANIFVGEFTGSEKLSLLFGGKLDENDAGNVQAALRDALRSAGLLNNDPETARYQLMTSVAENRLRGAADITVTTHMQFRLIDAVTGETLMDESIATPSTVLFSENHLYRVRIGKAMEGSIRENILVLLDRLGQLPVK